MVSLDSIRTRISQLTEHKGDAAADQDHVRALFDVLIYEDQPLFILYQAGHPALLPLRWQAGTPFLRIFSHREVSEQYLEEHEGYEVRPLTVLESVQMAKSFFLRGVEGFVLNESDKWVSITLPDYLGLFADRVLQDPSSCDTQCVAALLFINRLRANGYYHYGVLCNQDGTPMIAEDSIAVTREEMVVSGEGRPILLPISALSLYQIPCGSLILKDDDGVQTFSAALLRGAMAFLGYKRDESDGPLVCGQFCNEPLDITEADSDWHTEDFSLKFLPQDASVSPETVEETGEPEPAAPAEPEPEAPAPEEQPRPPELWPDVILPALLSARQRVCGWAGHWRDAVVRVLPVNADKSEGSEVPVPAPEEVLEEQGEQDEPVAVPEDMDEVGANEDEPAAPEAPAGRRARPPKGIIIGAAVLLLACCVVGGLFMARQHRYEQQVAALSEALQSRDYSVAYGIYEDARMGTDVDDLLVEHIDQLVVDYGNNRLSAEELRAALNALAAFPTTKPQLDRALLTASKLEDSKNAYVLGQDAKDIFTKLSYWKQVIDLDGVNYAAVQADIQEHSEGYKKAMQKVITYYAPLNYEMTKERVETMYYWFPDDEFLASFGKDYLEQRTEPLAYYPIEIHELDIRQSSDGYWTLTVDWENTSIKSISEIHFGVIALDEAGDQVISEDKVGTWSMYDARVAPEYGPFEPGETAGMWTWTHAFRSPWIVDIRLTGVNIIYRDGSSQSFVAETDLREMMTK